MRKHEWGEIVLAGVMAIAVTIILACTQGL